MFYLLTILSLLPALTHSDTVYLTFADETIATGQVALFRCNIHDLAGYNISNVFITNPQNETLAGIFAISPTSYLQYVPNAQYADSGVYICNVNITESVLTNTARLTVYVPASLVTQPVSGEFIQGSPFAISCLAQGFPTANVTWLREGQPILEITRVVNTVSLPFVNSSLNFPNPLLNQSGNYSCQVTNMYKLDDTDFNNIDTSTPALINIYPLPMVTSLGDRNVTIFQSVSIVCMATGVLPLIFTWQNLTDANTDLVSNAQLMIQHFDTSSILTITSTPRHFTGFYQCTVRNNFGHDTAQMYLLVQEQPSPPNPQPSATVLARSVLISWTLSFDGNSPIIEFIIELVQADSVTQVGMVSGANTSFNITSLSPYTMYTFRVKARNVIGESMPSPSVQVETQQAEPGSTPRNVTLSDATSDSISISWIPPVLNDWNGLVTHFIIEYTLVLTPLEGPSIVNSLTSTLISPLTNAQENNEFRLSINELESHQNYSIRITACTVAGCGVYSDVLRELTLESAPVTGPIVSLTEPTSTSIRIEWQEIPLRERNGLIQSYMIRWVTLDDVNATQRTGNNVREFTILNLAPYITYRVSVAGETNAIGVYGPETLVRTDEGSPSPPMDLRVTYLSYTQILFNWSPPLTPNGVITSFTLYYSQDMPRFNIRNSTVQTSIIVSGISIGVTGNAYITANTSAGEGQPSDVLTVKPATPPYVLTSSNSSNVTTHTRNINVFVGDDLSLDCLINAIPDPEYSWMSNLTGSLLGLPETVPRYYVPQTGPEFTSYYVCTAVNLFGSASIMFHVTVVQLPKVYLYKSSPEFCRGGNGGLNCRPGERIYISCSYTEGIPDPLINFTREGREIQGVQNILNRAEISIESLDGDNSRLYICEVFNSFGREREALFINLVGEFSIDVNDGVITWELPNDGYIEGNYVIEFGIVNITENIENVSSSPIYLNDVIVIPGVYAWRLKFVNRYGDAAISGNYPYYAGGTAQQVTMDLNWLYGLIAALGVLILIILIILIIMCVCVCKQRRYKRDSSSGVEPQEVVSNVSTTGFGSVPPVEQTPAAFDNQPPVKKSRKKHMDADTFRKTKEYTTNEAYRGPMAFHNQAVDTELEYSKPTYTTFKPASNLHFKRHKPSPVEPVGAVGFRRRNTPDFPAPPSIEDLTVRNLGFARDVDMTPPPPPIPDSTYKH